MTLHLKMPSKVNNLSPKISVIGVGGTGGNIINSMVQSNIEGVSFLNVNTDSQALKHSLGDQTLQLGPNCTQGLGAGANPEVGRESAEEVTSEIQEYLEDANMVFITAGMGGGTGTGASPVIAKIARDMGILIVGVVTKPFEMEGKRRMHQAIEGIQELQKYVDNLIVIPNQNIYHFAKPETTFSEALQLADNVLIDGVKSIIDLMVKPGIMNHDFADVKAVMSETGKVHMGTGFSEDPERAIKATEEAICNPLLENNSMTGAKGVLINVTGGKDITLHEVDQAVNRIREESDEDANIIWGLTQDENFDGKFKISVISTGIDSESYLKSKIEDVNVKELYDYKNTDLGSSNNISSIENNIIKETEIKNEDEHIDKQTNFFVNLENKDSSLNHDNKLKELEEKAAEFKVENNQTVDKKSFLSKIFGSKNSENEKDSDHVKMDKIEPQIKNTTSKNTIEIEVENGKELTDDLKENDFFENDKNTENELKSTSHDDDLLQIPAFLRRQAN
ncbi:cell division protein FtsZ [Rickettsiales bacterium]|nr:cell division protein FtsZ [Rickettsiales bacterium]